MNYLARLPPDSVIDTTVDDLKDMSPSKLDQLYRQFWRLLRNTPDPYSAEGDQYWVIVIAIEDVRQYQRGEVNAVRYGR